MSVYISDFSGPTWIVTHDDAPGGSHTSSIDPTEVVRSKNMDGTDNHNYAVIVCPVCSSVSTHPVGGGAQPPLVQEMFVHMAETDGCPCPEGLQRDQAHATAVEHVKQHAVEMDGEGRWQYTG